MLAESFGRDVWWLWRHRDAMLPHVRGHGGDGRRAETPTARRGRVRTPSPSVLTILAVVTRVGRPRRCRTSRTTSRWSVRAAAARGLCRPRAGRAAAATAAPRPGLGARTGARSAAAREGCSTSGSSRPSTGRSTRSTTGATPASASRRCARRSAGTRADLVVVAIVVLVRRRLRAADPGAAAPDAGSPPATAGGRSRSSRRSPPPGCSAGRSARRSSRVPRSPPRAPPTSPSTRCARRAGGPREPRRRSPAEIANDDLRFTPGNKLLTGLRGKDVLLVFVESYGKVAVQGSAFAPKVNAALDQGTAGLQAAGFSARTALPHLPTFGGISWLAHSTLQSGVWVDGQRRYDQLIASDRFTLSQAFKRAGLAHRQRRAVEQPGVAGGDGVLPLRPALRPAERRLPRPDLRLRVDAGPVRPRRAAASRALQAGPPAAVRARSTSSRATRRGPRSRS